MVVCSGSEAHCCSCQKEKTLKLGKWRENNTDILDSGFAPLDNKERMEQLVFAKSLQSTINPADKLRLCSSLSFPWLEIMKARIQSFGLTV